MVNINSKPTHPNKSVANIIYRELYTDEDFRQCITLQRDVFHIPDSHLVSPLFLKLIARKEPPIGISLGVFNSASEKCEMLGFIIGFSTFREKSIHTVMLGVKPELKNNIYGYKLLIKFKEAALAQNLTTMFCVFEPLESNLARLYMGMEGASGIKYINEPTDSALSGDKLLVKWNLTGCQKTNNNVDREKNNKKTHLECSPVATTKCMPDSVNVLVEIPDNFTQLKNENLKKAIEFREQTQNILEHYINRKEYIITSCITDRINNKRKSYYLLEKL